MSNIEHQSATELLQALRAGRLTVAQSVTASVERAHERASINALIHFANDELFGSAVEAATDALSRAKPLAGLPIVVKDNIDVAGMPTTAGSPTLLGNLASRSSSVVARLTAAGAVVIGKSNLHELSMGITTNNTHFGPTRNPYDLARIPGGSSGGTAAAVAAGIVTAGLGSDTGGSLRIPAALCGVVGFRPSTGRWPSDGVVKISSTRDTVGPIARTVADCALLDAVVTASDTALSMVSLAGLRIGVPRTGFWEPLEAQMHRAGEQVLDKLRANGVTLVPCDLRFKIEDCAQAGMLIAVGELLDSLRTYFRDHSLRFDPAAIVSENGSPDVRPIFESLLGPGAPPAAAYEAALHEQRPRFQTAYADLFAESSLDLLIFPTTPLPAALIGEDETIELAGQRLPTFPTFARNAAPGSVCGLPGISLPMGCNGQGLPMGIALDGPVGSDRRLLALAAAIESLLPPIVRPPR